MPLLLTCSEKNYFQQLVFKLICMCIVYCDILFCVRINECLALRQMNTKRDTMKLFVNSL